MPNVESATYHISIGNTHLRDLVDGGEFYLELPNGDELHISRGGLNDHFAEQMIDNLNDRIDE